MAEEERASGISPPEPTGLDNVIRDIIERGKKYRVTLVGEKKGP